MSNITRNLLIAGVLHGTRTRMEVSKHGRIYVFFSTLVYWMFWPIAVSVYGLGSDIYHKDWTTFWTDWPNAVSLSGFWCGLFLVIGLVRGLMRSMG